MVTSQHSDNAELQGPLHDCKCCGFAVCDEPNSYCERCRSHAEDHMTIRRLYEAGWRVASD